MKCIRIILFLFFNFSLLFGQSRQYTVANAHSHNDYLQTKPFTLAFEAGFGSIEADIFPINGDLLVAHTVKELESANSLKNLYLNPMKRQLRKHGRDIQLLIDIKADTKASMQLLIKQLKPLKKYLSRPDEKRRLKIVMTGQIPSPENYDDYPDYIYYDNDLTHDLTDEQWSRVGMVSVNFKSYSKWRGAGELHVADLTKLERAVTQAHEKNKSFRFWGAPDKLESWMLQQRLKVDWIGTDHIDMLRTFLKVPKP